uniref:Uncharacterized protein n=1 Tax=Brassica oleracea TaxID=3712 RepID=A0A3P6B1T7_BRAOL|nr:unnamed protein product [Brassica oleracea]
MWSGALDPFYFIGLPSAAILGVQEEPKAAVVHSHLQLPGTTFDVAKIERELWSVSPTSPTVVTNRSSFDPHLDPYPLEEISLPTVMSKALIYTDVNVIRPKEYWDYEFLNVEWGFKLSSLCLLFFGSKMITR